MYDSGVRNEAAGSDVTFQFTLGDGVFQILGLRLAVVQTAPEGAAPVEVRSTFKKSDGTYHTINLPGGHVTEAHPFALSTQPYVVGPGRFNVITVSHNAANAHRLTVTYRRVFEY